MDFNVPVPYNTMYPHFVDGEMEASNRVYNLPTIFTPVSGRCMTSRYISSGLSTTSYVCQHMLYTKWGLPISFFKEKVDKWTVMSVQYKNLMCSSALLDINFFRGTTMPCSFYPQLLLEHTLHCSYSINTLNKQTWGKLWHVQCAVLHIVNNKCLLHWTENWMKPKCLRNLSLFFSMDRLFSQCLSLL